MSKDDSTRKQARANLYDLQSEESFIIHCCNDPKLFSASPSIIDTLSGERKELAEAIYKLAASSQPLTEESLRLAGSSEELRGLFSKLVAQPLPESASSAVIEKLRDVAARREIATHAAKAFSDASEGSEKALASVESLERGIGQARMLLQGHLTAGGISRVGEQRQSVIDDIAWRVQNPCKIRGIEFGFTQLEKILDGLQPARFYLIGARPSVGKTAFAGDIAVNLLQSGHGGVFFSAEMSNLQLQQRLLARIAGVNPTKSIHGALTKSDLIDLRRGLTEMDKWPLWIDDTDRINIDLLKSRARKAVTKDGAKWIIVDYIGLIRGVDPKSRQSKREEVGEVSAALKALSKELSVPVIALAQLKRTGNAYNSASGSTEIPKPTLESLKETGDLEQDADTVILLHRDINNNIRDATAIVAKNRSGSLGSVDLKFSADTTSFTETSYSMNP